MNDAMDKVSLTSAPGHVTDEASIPTNDVLENIDSTFASSLITNEIDKVSSTSTSSLVTNMIFILTNGTLENIDSTFASSLVNTAANIDLTLPLLPFPNISLPIFIVLQVFILLTTHSYITITPLESNLFFLFFNF